VPHPYTAACVGASRNGAILMSRDFCCYFRFLYNDLATIIIKQI